MKSCFSHKFHLLDISKAIELVNIPGIRAQCHTSAPVFIFVDELHPEAVVFLPVYFLLSSPVEPVGSVGPPVGLVKFPKRGKCIPLVPLCTPLSHQVAACLVNSKGRVDFEIVRQQAVHQRVPAVTAWTGSLLP